jgi:regulator of protease activity HflC (stomatin/prohibitin superfamily)
MSTSTSTSTSTPPAQGPESQAVPDIAVRMPDPHVCERPALALPGWPIVAACLVVLAVGIALFVWGAGFANGNLAAAVGGLILAVLPLIAAGGFTIVNPGQARVIQLLGRYRGTVRADGLQWVNPLTTRRVVSTRIRNHETGTAKVNDADGNPIEIAAVVVWQVEDTAKATFEVENFVQFVSIQTETAVRHMAGSYPYDAHEPGKRSLLDNTDDITAALSAEISARVASAGVRIIESRVTQLSYAPEIAQAMLRRQQASAVVAARQQIVAGAVGMVQAALDRLAEEDVVALDEERKAAMVSNLMVVLCGDREAQPVVNAGSLYH